MAMQDNYFPLGNTDDSKFIKTIRIIFGIVCLGMAAWWVNFILKSSRTEWTLWLTIAFLAGFGLYQIWAGLGRATRYITFNGDFMVIKKNSILSPVRISAAETRKIDIYPLSIVFLLNSGKTFLLRFGTINYETNEKIVDEVIRFAEKNNVQSEILEEEI